MARIKSYRGWSNRRSFLGNLIQLFLSLDKFTKITFLILILLALTTPFLVKNLLQLGQRASTPYMFGTLQTNTANITSDYNAGVRVAELDMSWSQYETGDGVWNTTYINQMKNEIQQYQAAGMQVMLSFGIQYTPSWIFSYPNSYFVDQYGDSYTPNQSGKDVSNMVFNNVLRQKQAAYIQRVFQDLGTNFYGVRVGGGWYGELNYPDASYNSHSNTYWAFDQIAQGKATGLPSGMTTDPVPGWTPGTVNTTDASQFINWYMDSLKNYHDWQITTVRQFYPGKIFMLYPSWGVRPGQLSAAINDSLNDSSTAEVNGEVQRGFDFSRYIAGITDPNVVVYTTWLDCSYGSDNTTDQTQWRPVHWLSYLASQNPLHLQVAGENTGGNSYSQMQFVFQQMQTYNLINMNWAFEPQLYNTNNGTYASISQYASLISIYNPAVTDTPTPTPTPALTSTSILTVDDNVMGTGQNQWDYVGAWTHCTNCNETSPAIYYDASQSWDNTANDYVTVTFTGTQIAFYGVTGPWQGIAAMSIDGGTATNVDLYNSIKTGDVLLWTSPLLSNSTHTLKILVSGTKNSASSGDYIAVDRVDITQLTSSTATPTPAPAYTPTPTPIAPTPTPTTVPMPVSVSITYPSNGSYVARHSTVTISTGTSTNVTQVNFSVSGTLICSVTSAPFNCNWSVPGKPNAQYTITAAASDGLGDNASSSVNVTAH